MTTSNRTCEFCDEINGQLFDYSEFNITPKFGSRIIQSEKYPLLTVMPDRSPLLPGHSLICSKDHFTSFSDFNRFHNCSVVELFNIILRLSSMSVNNFSVEGLLFFEHGGNSCVKPNGCVDHAHIHIIPVNKIFYGKLQESLFYKYGLDEIISCSSLRKTYNFIQSKNNINEYVMIGYASKKIEIKAYCTDYIPSQLIRFVLAEILNIPPHMSDVTVRKEYFQQAEKWLFPISLDQNSI